MHEGLQQGLNQPEETWQAEAEALWETGQFSLIEARQKCMPFAERYPDKIETPEPPQPKPHKPKRRPRRVTGRLGAIANEGTGLPPINLMDPRAVGLSEEEQSQIINNDTV